MALCHSVPVLVLLNSKACTSAASWPTPLGPRCPAGLDYRRIGGRWRVKNSSAVPPACWVTRFAAIGRGSWTLERYAYRAGWPWVQYSTATIRRSATTTTSAVPLGIRLHTSTPITRVENWNLQEEALAVFPRLCVTCQARRLRPECADDL